MFQSTDDDLNFDEDFFNEAFDAVETNKEQNNKRNSDEYNNQSVKKRCTDALNIRTQNILAIINPKLPETVNNVNSFENPDRNRRVVQRKFPGPAGILPDEKKVNLNVTVLEEINVTSHKKLELDEIVCSQITEDNFKKGPWNRMLENWSNTNCKVSLSHKYTISWIKSKALSKELIGQKAPFLAAVIQSVDDSSKDHMVVLKDKTGEIHASLAEMWDDYYEFLKSGSVIVVKQIGVLATLKKFVLTITRINVIAIYSGNDETNEEAQIMNLQKLTILDVIKTIEDVKRKHAAFKQAKRLTMQQSVVSNNPYFKTNKNEQQNSSKQNNTNIEIQNKTLQLISNLRTANRSVCETNANVNNLGGNATTSSTPNKFKFNAKNTEPNKENSIITTESDTEILSQVLEGVDADSIFDDF